MKDLTHSYLFLPVLMAINGPDKFFKEPHGVTLFYPQWNYMSWRGEKLRNLRQIKLEDVTGTTIEIEGFKVDMSNHHNTKSGHPTKWASDQEMQILYLSYFLGNVQKNTYRNLSLMILRT